MFMEIQWKFKATTEGREFIFGMVRWLSHEHSLKIQHSRLHNIVAELMTQRKFTRKNKKINTHK